MPSFPTDISVDNAGNEHITYWDLKPEHTKKESGSFNTPKDLSQNTGGDESGISVDTDDRDTYHAAFENESTDQAVHAFGVSTAVWERSSDADEDDEVTGSIAIWVASGDTYSGVGFVLISDDPISVGTDPIEWDFYGGTADLTAGDGLTKGPKRIDLNASDESISVLADSFEVNIDEHFVQTTLEKVPEGIRIGTADAGKILIGQNTGSDEKTSFEAVSGDMLLESDGNSIIQTASSLIENANDTGGGLKLTKASPGDWIIGKGTASGDPEVTYETPSGDISVQADGTVTVSSEFTKNANLVFRETFQTDGNTSTFSLSFSPLSEANTQANYKELVFLNGTLQREGSTDDYTKPNATDINFNDTPLDGGIVSVMYMKA